MVVGIFPLRLPSVPPKLSDAAITMQVLNITVRQKAVNMHVNKRRAHSLMGNCVLISEAMKCTLVL